MGLKPLQKQISIYLPISDWKALRREAAKQRVPITELCRGWLRPELQELHKRNQQKS